MSSGVLVVYGAGGHGKVVADALLARGSSVAGFLDDARPIGTTILGLPILGGAFWLTQNIGARVALGIGNNIARGQVADACLAAGAELAIVVHPQAVVAPSARISEGAVIMALSVVNPDAQIGRAAILNTGCVVEHDCVVGPFAHVSPNAAIAGGCKIGAYAHVGIGAAMLPGVSLGEHAVLGGGALASRDIPAGVIARGVPASTHRLR